MVYFFGTRNIKGSLRDVSSDKDITKCVGKCEDIFSSNFITFLDYTVFKRNKFVQCRPDIVGGIYYRKILLEYIANAS